MLSKVLLVFILAFASSESLKNRVVKRQNSHCANHSMGDFVENPDDCRLFYWCGENGEAISASCPPNMLFNPESMLCDMAASVKCTQTTHSPPLTTVQTTETVSAEATIHQYCANAYAQQPNSESLIFIAHPRNCQQYYMCYYGKALLQQCSSYLQWNSRVGKCDLPANAGCKPNGGSMMLPITPPTSLGSTTSIDGDGIICPSFGQHIFPHMQRCDFFIYCVKGYVILQRCPFYRYFDVESSRCISLKRALCIKDLKLEFRRNTF